MAIRPVYFATCDKGTLVEKELFDFKWHPGLTIIQKQKSIDELHTSVLSKYPNKKILEVSSKSPKIHGVSLSAFNLNFHIPNQKRTISVETAFQSSKVFSNGGPYSDLLDKTSLDAKKDLRLKNSGDLLYFSFFQEKWSLTPKTAFYDWLYINALSHHTNLIDFIIQYDCFTDIEFNPEKSINCQAQSAALFVSLYKTKILQEALTSKVSFLNVTSYFYNSFFTDEMSERTLIQGTLL